MLLVVAELQTTGFEAGNVGRICLQTDGGVWIDVSLSCGSMMQATMLSMCMAMCSDLQVGSRPRGAREPTPLAREDQSGDGADGQMLAQRLWLLLLCIRRRCA